MSKKWPGKVLTESKPSVVCKLHWKKRDVVLKVKVEADPMTRNMFEREKVALDVLKNLAVPKRVIMPRAAVSKLISKKTFAYVAMEGVSGRGCFGRQFSVPQSLGLWAFTIEHFCAFHRNRVLYTDMKHNHLRLLDDLSEAHFIDFDSCVMVEHSGRYPRMALGFTPELAPPEFQFSKIHGENVVVYQLGMLLGSFLLKYFHNSDVNLKSFKKINAKLSKHRSKKIFNLLKKCLSTNPKSRPKSFEDLFARLQKIELPRASYELWIKLRSPYQKELRKLGFKDPKVASII